MKNSKNVKTILGFAILVILILAVVYIFDRSSGREDGISDNAARTEETGDSRAAEQQGERIIIGSPTPLEAADTAYLYDEKTGALQKVDQPAGWRVEDIRKSEEAVFEKVFNDPEATRFLLGGVWDIVLRDEQAVAYQNPSFIGLIDEGTAAIIAEKDARHILFVRAGGAITEMYELPALYKIHGVFGNAVWLSTALQGEGLESDPQGPAHIVRVDIDGAESLLKEDLVIERLVAHGTESFAYQFSNGSYKARRGNYLWEGNGTPLFWLNENDLLINQGKTLKRVNLAESSQDTIGDIEGRATVADRIEFITE